MIGQQSPYSTFVLNMRSPAIYKSAINISPRAKPNICVDVSLGLAQSAFAKSALKSMTRVAPGAFWRRVRPFRRVETARVRYLTEAECIRLVNACEPAFRNLVRGALLTGCRYSELANMKATDFNSDAGVVTIRHSKAGKPRHVVLTNEGQRLFAKLAVGKLGDDLIFTRRDGGAWRNSHQLRPMLEACKHAKIKPAVSFHVLRHTHGSTLAMKGVPMGVIAEQLGHADTRMTEKHYAHLAPSYVADTIRAISRRLELLGKVL